MQGVVAFSFLEVEMKRILVAFAAIITSSALIFGIVLSAFYVGFAKGNYYVIDEALFDNARVKQNTVYYEYDGKDFVEVFDTANIIGREWVSIDMVGENLIKAFISAEDRDFYNHRGINIKRTLGAVLNYIFRTRSVFGASTITQQVVKNISGDNDRSIKRKVNEIMRAIHLERLYEKDEILEVYLNIVPMTGQLCGVGVASKTYFGKTTQELTLAEAATIAGITNSPVRYNPYNHPDACLEKRNTILYAMFDCGAIDEEAYHNAINTSLNVKKSNIEEKTYSWFVESANKDIISDLMNKKGVSSSAASLLLQGCKIYLTEDVRVQNILERYFEDPQNFSPLINDGLVYSMIVIDNFSGDLVGIVGGVGRKTGNGLLNMTEVKVPPASTLKPLAIYAPMIDCGMINAATVIDDTPLTIEVRDSNIVAYPRNSPDVYSGLTTVTDAICLSKNTVAAKLLERYGYERCASELVKRYGFDIISKSETVNGKVVSDMGIAPLALGQLSKGVTLRQLTNAYTAFPRDGVLKQGNTYSVVLNSEGDVLVSSDSIEKRIYSEQTARIMNQILMNVVDSGTARSIRLKEQIDTSGKTGTSGNNYDRLFVGYTPYYTAGIWCGYPDRSGTVSGVYPTHLNTWDDVMEKIHCECVFASSLDPISFATKGLVRCEYCKDSGALLSDICHCDLRGDRVRVGYFAKDNLPKTICDIHYKIPGIENAGYISAPYICRKTYEGIVVEDEKYNYLNLINVAGF